MSEPSMSQSSPNTTPPSHPRLRTLANAAVVLFAAFASIATSAPRWHVAATTPVAKASSGKGQLVTIEASAEPTVRAENGPITRRLRPEGQAGAWTWTGRANYFVPPSEVLKSVVVEGICNNSSLCSKCEPPPGAFARIVSSVEVLPWVLDASSKPMNITMSAAENDASFRVRVAATRPPALAITLAAPIDASFSASEAPGLVDPKDDDPKTGMKGYAFSVTWYRNSKASADRISGTWTPNVTISGYCQEPGPCVAPTSERVTILSVEGPPGTGAWSSSPPPAAAPVGSVAP
jgi:hypothetical protein